MSTETPILLTKMGPSVLTSLAEYTPYAHLYIISHDKVQANVKIDPRGGVVEGGTG